VICIWGSKGGVGCSVVTAAAATISARTKPTLVVDLAGDMGMVLGVGETGPGLGDWFEVPDASPEALGRLEIPVTQNLSLLAMGRSLSTLEVDSAPGSQVEVLARVLEADRRVVLVDVGLALGRFAPVMARASRSVFVARPCYLALARVRSVALPDAMVVVREPGRVLTKSDMEHAVGCPVEATIQWDPAVARAVDAGLLIRRLPRSLRKLEVILQ